MQKSEARQKAVHAMNKVRRHFGMTLSDVGLLTGHSAPYVGNNLSSGLHFSHKFFQTFEAVIGKTDLDQEARGELV